MGHCQIKANRAADAVFRVSQTSIQGEKNQQAKNIKIFILAAIFFDLGHSLKFQSLSTLLYDSF